MGIPINDTGYVQVVINYLMANGSIANTVTCYEYSGAALNNDSDNLLDMISDGWQLKADVIKNVMSNSCVISGANCGVWNPVDERFDPIGLATFSATGASVAPVTPSGNSGLGLCQTVVPSIDGKIYLPGISTSQLDGDGNFSAAGLINLLSAVATIFTVYNDPSGMNFDPVVFSRKYKTFNDLISYGASAIVAYQRRRKQGVGS